MFNFNSKLAFTAAMAALSLFSVSCQKDVTPDIKGQQQEEQQKKIVSLKVNVFGDIRTRATLNEEGEAALNKIEVFVFNADAEGKLDVYATAAGQSSLTLNCTSGDKDIYALANSALTEDALKKIDSKQKFLAITTQLQENKTTGFVMLGSKTETINSDTEVEIAVSRFVSRIGIGTIKTDFTASAYKSKEFVIKRIYLVNAVGSTNFGLTSTPTSTNFYNFKRCIGSCEALLSYRESDITIANGSSQAIDQYFYTLPNPTTVDCQNPSSDDPRFTRLVVEATLGGTTYYYPISIVGEDGTLQANKSFMIKSLTITRPGSLSPDVPFEIASSAIAFEVTPWDGTETDEII